MNGRREKHTRLYYTTHGSISLQSHCWKVEQFTEYWGKFGAGSLMGGGGYEEKCVLTNPNFVTYYFFEICIMFNDKAIFGQTGVGVRIINTVTRIVRHLRVRLATGLAPTEVPSLALGHI
jgi:hypothetical protein